MPSPSIAAFLLVVPAAAMPATSRKAHTRASNPPAWFLAGDSTTAVQSTSGGGWGEGFLSFVDSPAWGTDYGHNGATTASFVSGGDWDTVIDAVKNSTDDYRPYVTIQFGHNDQKSSSGITLDEYQANLEDMTDDVRAAGGTPILVTPLSRRVFTDETNLTLSLVEQRQYTIYAAENTSTAWIDLNQASVEYLEAIGNTSAYRYNLHGTDTTHLNDWGSVVFGRMVADLILGHDPVVPSDTDWTPDSDDYFTQYFISNETLSEEIWGGVVA